MNNTGQTPKHIAIIMDGNGRWAESQGMNRSEGHAQGVETLRYILELCEEFGINYLTTYAFSTENWNRPPEEINTLMSLLSEYLKSESNKLYKQKIKLRIIGDTSLLPQPLQRSLQQTVTELDIPEHTRVLTLALSYGGRNEIIRATQKIAQDILDNHISVRDISEELFAKYLDTADIPDPDLLIRTAGELRLSNFLLWQLSYAELYATDTLWPDFSRDDFIKALNNYKSRTRKFGKIIPQTAHKK